HISIDLKENKYIFTFNYAKYVHELMLSITNPVIVVIDCYICSLVPEFGPFDDALNRTSQLLEELEAMGIRFRHFDCGGGLGVCYRDEQAPAARDYAALILDRIKARDIELILEPGRSIAANAGVFLTQVEFLKQNEDKHFA